MHDIYNNKNVDTTKMKDKSVAKGMNEYGYEVYAANTKKNHHIYMYTFHWFYWHFPLCVSLTK